MSRSPAAPSSTTPSSESSRDALPWACYAASSRAGLRMLSTPPSIPTSPALPQRAHATRVSPPSPWTSFSSSFSLRRCRRAPLCRRSPPYAAHPARPAVLPAWAGQKAGPFGLVPGLHASLGWPRGRLPRVTARPWARPGRFGGRPARAFDFSFGVKN